MSLSLCASAFSLVYRLNSIKWLISPLHRKCINSTPIFRSVSNGAKSTINQKKQVEHVCNLLEKIMNTLPPVSDALSPSDTLNIFKRLSELTRCMSSSPASFKVFEHDKFDVLRQAIKSSVPYYKATEKFNVFLAIQTLSVPIDDEVCNTLLSSLQKNVINISLNEIMILDAILATKQKTQFTDALHQELIEQFNAKTSQIPVNFNYFDRTKRILEFIKRNKSAIIDEVFENLKNSMIQRDIDIFTAHQSMNTIIALSYFGDKCGYFEPILEKSFDVWQSSTVTVNMVDTVLKYLAKNISTVQRYEMRLYKDARFVEKCAHVVINRGNAEKCLLVQNRFNQLEFSSERLIDHLLEYIKNERNKERFFYNSIVICRACDVANYRPPVFQDFLAPIVASMNFHQQFDIKLNWPKFALSLKRLGIEHKLLITEILEQRSRFKFTANSIQELETLEFEKLTNAHVGDSLTDLKLNFDEYIRILVHTNVGTFIPLLVKIDLHTKCVVPFGETKTNSLSSIKCDDNHCLVGFVSASNANVRYWHSHLVTRSLNSTEWFNLLQHKTKDEFFKDVIDHIEN